MKDIIAQLLLSFTVFFCFGRLVRDIPTTWANCICMFVVSGFLYGGVSAAITLLLEKPK